MTAPYRTLFLGELVQESFMSTGGTDDPYAAVDGPLCRDGAGRPTMRGSGIAGALVATLRQLKGSVPSCISGAVDGAEPSAWRTFNSHPAGDPEVASRQHVAINAKTGAAEDKALFSLDTLPPGTRWPFLLEVDTTRHREADDLAQAVLSHWAAGRCLFGREVARGLGWLRLDGLHSYALPTNCRDRWPNAEHAAIYACYVADTFAALAQPVPPATDPLPGTVEVRGRVIAGPRQDGYGIDSLSVGGHASEELASCWDDRFLAPDGMDATAARTSFDPDFAVVTMEQGGRRVPYIPGSALRGPMRHALARLQGNTVIADRLFGTVDRSARLLIRDAFPVAGAPMRLAWIQHHAEDEFAASSYDVGKFDRVAVMQGSFEWRMLLEAAGNEELDALRKEGLDPLLQLAREGRIAVGGGQWRGHGWVRWEIDEVQGGEEARHE